MGIETVQHRHQIQLHPHSKNPNGDWNAPSVPDKNAKVSGFEEPQWGLKLAPSPVVSPPTEIRRTPMGIETQQTGIGDKQGNDSKNPNGDWNIAIALVILIVAMDSKNPNGDWNVLLPGRIFFLPYNSKNPNGDWNWITTWRETWLAEIRRTPMGIETYREGAGTFDYMIRRTPMGIETVFLFRFEQNMSNSKNPNGDWNQNLYE